MYGYNNHYTYSASSADHFLSHLPSPDTTMTPLPPPNFPSLPPLTVPTGNDYGYNSSSGCSSYGSPSSHTSYSTPSPSLIQRSLSSHSLPKNINRHLAATSPAEYLELDTNAVRRVLSTGDLQGINMMQHYQRSDSPLSNENSSSIIESMSKACRYSPEEKKERIERYRSKRTQRNFDKKIKYVCRKTLADSRPRIRGRFARNDELEKISQTQWSQTGLEEEEDDEYWMKLLNSFSGNVLS